MITGLVVSIVVGLLALAAYFSRRRFGTLTLALAAGFVIATYEAQSLAALLRDYNVSFGMLNVTTAVAMLIIIVPSVLLFFGGPTYSNKRHRVVGSVAYGVAALFFCLGALEHSLVLVGQEKVVFDYISHYREQAIVGILIAALFDMFFIHTMRRRKRAE